MLFQTIRAHFLAALLCLLALSAFAQGGGADNPFNTVTYRSLPPLAVRGQGVSAPFAGAVPQGAVAAGGCNFADVPAAEGGQKVFYDDVYLIDAAGGGQWQRIGALPRPLAYGASVQLPDGGVACVGGTDGKQSRAEAFAIHIYNNECQRTPLPSLPVRLHNAAGTFGGGYIYILCGETDGAASHGAFRLRYPGGTEWEQLPDVPGAGRMQPCAVVQNGATGSNLYLLGGYDTSGADSAAVHTDGLVLDLHTMAWRSVAPIKPHGSDKLQTLIGANAAASGCCHIVCFGGVDAGVFRKAVNRPYEMRRAEAQGDAAAEVLANLKREAEEYLCHPAEWYRFRKDLLIYNTITDTWVSESQSPLLARAGAGLVTLAPGRWLLIGGEEKPGVRAADVTEVTMGVRTSFGLLNWAVLAAYLIGMVLLGYYFMRREGGAGDFFTGGGRVPWWAAGMSIYATMLSAITYMAYPAKAFATDWTYYPMLVTILLVSFPVIRYYLPFFRRLNVTSAYEYLERRFNAATRLMASALFIVFMVARMALVLYLPSLALTAVTGIDIYVCIVLMGCVTIVYCTMGGVEAVVWGDVVQGFILVGGAVLAAGFLIFGTEGGFEGFLAIGSEAGKFRLFDWSFDYRSATFWVIILGGMANNLISYTSDQTVIQRYLTTKDERSARQSILMNGAMSVGVSIVFFVIGAGLYTFYKTNPAAMDFTMQKADVIFPFFMMSQLPAGVAGLLIAAVFAATMSTISSNINSVATAFSIDFYKRRRPQTGDKEMLRVARRACVAAGGIGMAIALLMATWEILALLDFFQEILGLPSGGVGGLFLMGIFVPRIGGKAALTGFVCGVTAVFVTKYCTEASFLLYGFISMLVSVLTALLASYVFKEPRGGKGLTWKTLE